MNIDNSLGLTSEDPRASLPLSQIAYKNVHKFRVIQTKEGEDLRGLTDEQWGLVSLEKCHHISTTSTGKDGPQSFRVRICKTCCQEDCHIELGTYVDQESAILVNDTFEILNDRVERLIMLKATDRPYLHLLTAKKYDRSKGRDYAFVLDLISERIASIEEKRLKQSNNNNGNSTSISLSSSSSNARSKILIDALDSGGSVGSDTGRYMEPRKKLLVRPKTRDDRNFTAIRTDHNSNVDSIDHHAAAMALVEVASAASNEMSSLPDRSDNINYDQNSSFHMNEAELSVRKRENVRKQNYERGSRDAKKLSSLTPRKRSATFSDSGSYFASYLTEIHQRALNFPSNLLTDSEGISNGTYNNFGEFNYSNSLTCNFNGNIDSIGPSFLTPHSNDQVSHHGTDSHDGGVEEVAKGLCALSGSTKLGGVADMNWHQATEANIEDEEVDVAKSLFALRAAPDTSLSSPIVNNHKQNNSMNSFNSRRSFNSYDNPSNNLRYRHFETNNVNYARCYDSPNEFDSNDERLYHDDAEEDESKGDDLQSRIRSGHSSPTSSPSSPYGSGTGSVRTMVNSRINYSGRARSNSMPTGGTLDRSDIIWSILGNVTYCRSRGDPLSVALRKYYERGGVNGSGFIGIYSPEDRRQRIERFLEKRKRRMWTKKVKYDVRKNFADSRVRVKGRFVKKNEQQKANSAALDDTGSDNALDIKTEEPFATDGVKTYSPFSEDSGSHVIGRTTSLEKVEKLLTKSDSESELEKEMNSSAMGGVDKVTINGGL